MINIHRILLIVSLVAIVLGGGAYFYTSFQFDENEEEINSMVSAAVSDLASSGKFGAGEGRLKCPGNEGDFYFMFYPSFSFVYKVNMICSFSGSEFEVAVELLKTDKWVYEYMEVLPQ